MSPFQRLMKAVKACDTLEDIDTASFVDGLRAQSELLDAARALVDVDVDVYALQRRAKPAHRPSHDDRIIYSARIDVPSYGGGFDLRKVLGNGWTHLSGLYVDRDVDGSDVASVQFSRPATPEEIEAARAERVRLREEADKSEKVRRKALYEELKAEFGGGE